MKKFAFILLLAAVCIAEARPTTIGVLKVSQSSDDAQEKDNGKVKLGEKKGDLSDRLHGFRFNGLNVQQGFGIESAKLRFVSGSKTNRDDYYVIRAQDSDNAATFDNVDDNISSRPSTDGVEWVAPSGWDKDEAYFSADISAVVQDVVNRPGWTAGNSIGILAANRYESDGNKKREYRTYDKDDGSDAPELHVTYEIPSTCALLAEDAAYTIAYTQSSYGSVEGGVLEGASATISCNAGYHGCETVRECGSDGNWNGVFPSCAVVTQSANLEKKLLPGVNSKCNDGTPPSYYVALSPNNSKKWIIELEGGGACSVAMRCRMRSIGFAAFVTSNYNGTGLANGQPCTNAPMQPLCNQESYPGTGIMSSNPALNPNWWDANRVFIHYCSSDIFTGTNPNRDPATGYYFQGQLILDEVIDTLGSQYALGCATDIILSGQPLTGGIGVMWHIDRLVNTKFNVLSPNARVTGLADSSVLMTGNGYNNVFLGYKVGALNDGRTAWQPQYPAHCVAAGHADEDCYFVHLVADGVQTPIFWVQNFYAVNMFFDLGVPPPTAAPHTPEQGEYVREVYQYVRDFIATRQQGFAVNCINHHEHDRAHWTAVSAVGSGGRTASSVHNDWYTNTGNSVLVYDPEWTGTPAFPWPPIAQNPTCGLNFGL